MPDYCCNCESDMYSLNENGYCTECVDEAVEILGLAVSKCCICNNKGVILHGLCFNCLLDAAIDYKVRH